MMLFMSSCSIYIALTEGHFSAVPLTHIPSHTPSHLIGHVACRLLQHMRCCQTQRSAGSMTR